MKLRHIVVCLALSLLGAGLRAQNELPQVFSPNAAELGKYGKIPVSYFNGLPNISIPLTELRAKGYTLPVYLTYHAGGNKPDQHPGWVGLGWTLHAGGCINRIVHGMKDEMTKTEAVDSNPWNYPEDPGYYYYASAYQRMQIDSTVLAETFSDTPPDMDPDEFQVNIEGLNSSFYFVGIDSVKISSPNAVDYTVHMEIATSEVHNLYENPLLPVTQHNYIRTIEITTREGVIYRFGGTDSAIDYSYETVTPGGNHYSMNRTPTSWNISSIIFPDGEEITFEYQKAGVPIVALERHYYEHCEKDLFHPLNQEGYTYDTDDGTYKYINFTFIEPSYLHRISARMTGESISFSISPTVEKADQINSSEFNNRICYHFPKMDYSLCMLQNKYQKLDSIASPRGKIFCEYTSSTNERLKLLAVTISSGKNEKRFGMQYNNLKLPDYRSRNTDMWGFYSRSQIHDETGVYYLVDGDASRAEILEKLIYPTGGETRFEYELHQYGKVVQQEPFVTITENGAAGGLRIKRITDVLGGKEETREYKYIEENGAHSGVLATKPRFSASGKVGLYLAYYKRNDTTLTWQFIDSTSYYLSGERRLNQIPLTGGNHVTYSRVEECFPDSSKKVYYYSNHEDVPDERYLQWLTSYNDNGLFNSFCSNELSRGLLLKEEFYSNNGTIPVKVEEFHYTRDTLDYVQAITQIKHCNNLLSRSFHVLYYTYHPYLLWKRITSYSDNGISPHIELICNTYDSHRRLTGTTRRVGGVTERDTLTYTGNFTTGDYAGMVAHKMIAYPVEQVRFRKDTLQSEKVVSADLTTWKRWGDRFVPSETYKANAGSGLTGTFRFYNGSRKDFHYLLEPEQKFTAYDSLGNVVLTEDHAGVPASYVWTPDGCHPAAVFTGAKVGYTKYVTGDVARVLNYQLEPTEDVSLQFESVSSFTLQIWLTCPNNQCWDLAPVVDGTNYRIVCVNDPLAPIPWPANAVSYPSPLEIPLPAGIHSVSIRPSSHMYVVNSTDPVTFSIEVVYKEKQVTEQQIAGHTVVFEDFEDEEGELVPEGYNSEKGHRGTWTHALDAAMGPYYVDYRVYRNGKWNYVRQRETGSSTSISEGFAPIDHVRIYPVDCLPESYTWNGDGTLRSKTDSRGVTESYCYDGLGRLVGVYDNDGKKVEGYEYNYQNR